MEAEHHCMFQSTPSATEQEEIEQVTNYITDDERLL